MIKAIIFDLDNTLVDFMKMKDDAVNAAINAMIDAGLKMTAPEARRRIYEIYQKEGIEFQEVFDLFLTECCGTINPKYLAAGIVAYRRAREAALVLYPHVNFTLIELMKRGLKLAVLSDAPRKQAWLRLCYLNLHYLFEIVVTFEDTLKRKPEPEPFRKVLDELKVLPEEALMVGDWPERDMTGASKLGIKTVYAKYGDVYDRFSKTNAIEPPKADFTVEDIAELIDIVEKLNEKS